MPTIEISEEMFSRVERFATVVSAVLDEAPDTSTVFDIVLDRGLKAALGDVVARQDESIFLEALHQLAAGHPEIIYPFVADRVALGSDTRTQRARRKRIGFVKPSKRSR